MKTLKRIGLGLLTLLALLAIWIAVNSIDDRELSEQAKEMLKPVPEVPLEENGFNDIAYLNIDNFKVFTNGQEEKTNKAIRGEEWDSAFIDQLLLDKEKIVEDAITSTQKPRFKFPAPANTYDLPSFTKYNQVANVLLLKTESTARHSDLNGSIRLYGINIKFCRNIMTEEDHYLISWMIGLYCTSDALFSIHHFVANNKLSKNQLKILNESLETIRPYQSDDFHDVFRSEFQFAYRVLNDNINKPFKERFQFAKDLGSPFFYKVAFFPKYFFHPNSTLNKNVSVFITSQNDVQHFCNNLKTRDEYKLLNAQEEKFSFLRKDDVGWNWTPYFERRCLAHTYFDAVTAIVAIQAYQRDHQALPATLNELVPEYLDKLPIDYFNGETLKYSREHKWLYSVGTDYKDDGGSESGYTRGRCYHPDEKNRCDTNPTFPIDWNDYPASVR
jgi:hypothetical protein